MLRRYRERFAAPAPAEMLYGYEAMALMLETLRRAGDRANERTYVAELVRRTRRPRLGARARTRSGPNGDTTLRRVQRLPRAPAATWSSTASCCGR